MSYIKTELNNCIHIDHLYTIHYFEYTSTFHFPGEAHDFWEFIYVDKGNVDICMNEKEFTLKKGEIAFHQPNEFHKVSTYGHLAPNLVVISFHSDSPAMDFFRNQVMKLNQKERSLLAEIIVAAKNLFSSPLDDPYLTKLEKKEAAPLGTEQLIRIYIEQFLIHLLQRYSAMEVQPEISTLKNTNDIFLRVTEYMENNISEHLTIEKICWDNMISRTQLHKIIHQKTGTGIIDYFLNLKIEHAKHLIRDGRLNFTQISEQLGYPSIHYFSRQFKKISGMSPSDYSSSVKAITEKNKHEV